MRIAISHTKSQKEAMRIVDQSADDFFKGVPLGPLQIVDQQKSWNGSTMNFSFTGKLGFVKIPIPGTVEVTDKEIIVEVEIPGLLGKLVSEDSVRTGIQSRVRGLLSA